MLLAACGASVPSVVSDPLPVVTSAPNALAAPSAAPTAVSSAAATPVTARPSTPTPGPPRVTFLVDPDVPAEHERDIRDGIAMADQYFATVFGAMRTRPFSVQVRWAGPWEPGSGNGCCYADGPRSEKIHFHVSVEFWSESQVGTGRLAHLKSTIHEYTHLWQGEPGGRGCFQHAGVGYVAPKWFTEGLAEFAAYDALRSEGLLSDPQMGDLREGTRTGRTVVALQTLESSQWPSNIDAYGVSRLAVERLAQAAGPQGIARFCGLVGGGVPWATAFNQVFGLPKAEFYTAFDLWMSAGQAQRTEGPISLRFIEQLPVGSVPGPPGAIPVAFDITGTDLRGLTREQAERLVAAPAWGWTSTPRHRLVVFLGPSTPPGQQELIISLPDGREARVTYQLAAR